VRSQKNWIFISFILFLMTALVWSHGVFQTYFASRPEALFEVEKLKTQIAAINKEKKLLSYQFEDFRQNAALHWPEARKRDYRWPASVNLDLSSTQYEKGRQLFKKGQMDAAYQVFDLLITEFPHSKWITESYYYRCEILFQSRDYKNFTTCASEMVELFPENTLTGFQILRLAQTHEIHGQTAEALELYRLVRNQFSSEPVLNEQSLSSVQRLRTEF
jgi:TolA-binding protein